MDQTNTTVGLYSNNYKITVTNEKIAYNNITKKNGECTNTDYSYECQLNLDSKTASDKKVLLNKKINSLNNVVKHGNKYYMGIKDACELLYNN